VTEATVLEALRAVKDPQAGQDVVALGLVRDLTIEDSRVVRLAFTNQSAATRSSSTAERRGQ
jgi:metal-sulfur cluster biosynthetic enzyme